jgi:predicted nucleic acid-binding protein
VRIVLDTTILVPANERSNGLAPELPTIIVVEGTPLRASTRCCFQNEMLHELAKVLRYPRLQEFYGMTEDLF